jgi:YesN/AraC family two-component response regulator
VIFTTSYDEYALQAFKVNSIDYLLKPIQKEDLQRSLKKLRDLRGNASTDNAPFSIEKLIKELKLQLPADFLLKHKILPIFIPTIGSVFSERIPIKNSWWTIRWMNCRTIWTRSIFSESAAGLLLLTRRLSKSNPISEIVCH